MAGGGRRIGPRRRAGTIVSRAWESRRSSPRPTRRYPFATAAAGLLYSRDSNLPEAGMFVLRANSFEEAEAIAATDPLHVAGLRTYTIQKWAAQRGQHHGHDQLFGPDRQDFVGAGRVSRAQRSTQ
jgi:hypothetical protein